MLLFKMLNMPAEELKIFDGISEDVKTKIIATCPTEIFPAGTLILVEGEVSNGKGYIIKSGRIAVKIKWNLVSELIEWEMFGEIALLNEELRTATIEALETTECIILQADHLIDMINSDENLINKEIVRRMEENLKRG
jgi:CRP-like cAMP-binding protein